MAVSHGPSNIISSERRRQQAASASRTFSPSRQRAEKQSSRGGLLFRWLPFGTAHATPVSKYSDPSRKLMKNNIPARQVGTGTCTPRKASRRPCGLFAKLWDVEILFSSVFKLCLLVSILTGLTCLFLVHLDSGESPKKFSLALSGPGLSPDFALPVRYLYITLTPVRDQSNKDGNSAQKFAQLFSAWWKRLATSPFSRGKSHEDSSVPADESHIQLDAAKWNVTWMLKPLPPASLVGKKLASFTVVHRGSGVYILRFRLLQSIPKGYTLEAKLSHTGKYSPATGNKNGLQIPARPLEILPQTFTLEGPVYIPSSCPCPVKGSQARWLQALQCPEIFAQLTEDLFPFRVIDLHYIRQESRKLVGPQSLRSLVHYVVKDNQLYRRSLGPLLGFQYFSDAVFSYLTSVVKLPGIDVCLHILWRADTSSSTLEREKQDFLRSHINLASLCNPYLSHSLGVVYTVLDFYATDVEFLFNLGDWPIEHRDPDAGGLPIFGWSGGTAYADIILPQWEVLKGMFMLGLTEAKGEDLLTAQRVSHHTQLCRLSQRHDCTYGSAAEDLDDSHWGTLCLGDVLVDDVYFKQDTSRPLKDRIPKALFRGRDSNPIRIEAARLARKYPSLLDVQITSWEKEENMKAEKELGGGSRTRIPLQKFGDYKYQLLLDGTVAAYRTPYLFHSGSVPLKHDSEYYEWFYSDLVPMEHYIPFQADLSDLVKQLQWAEEHPEKTAEIAKNGLWSYLCAMLIYSAAQHYARENLTPDKVVCYYYRALVAYALRQNSPPEVDDDMVKVGPGPRDAGCSCAFDKREEQAYDMALEDDYPIVAVYPDNAEEILGRAKTGVVLLAYSSFCNPSALYMPKFLKLARLYTEKEAPLVFAAADGNTYTFPSAYHFCNFPGAQPRVMFLKPREHEETGSASSVNAEKLVPDYMREPLTLYDTANFVNKYLAQQFHVEVEKDPLDEMSQPIPTDNDKKLIKTVVGANFDDFVLNNTKDVLLFLHAPWCGLCNRFKHVYQKFAEEVRNSPFLDELLFTSMNGSENRLRYREFSWSSYPVLWYVSGDVPAQRMRPALFSGPWNLAGLKHFVLIQRKASEDSSTSSKNVKF